MTMKTQYENEVEQFQVQGLKVFVCTDPYPQNPRTEWDNAGTMVCFHKKYNLGDRHDFPTPEAFRLWWEEYGEGGTLLPLYLYDHSGITMRTTPFTCPWDSGQVGWIYMTVAKAKSEGIQDPVSYLGGEVATYDEYLTGNVYGFSVEDSEGDILDSSWGYVGLEHCREEARHTAEGYAKQP
jgi:hypothetical protein